MAVYCGTNVCGTATGEADAAEQNLSEFMAVPVFFANSFSTLLSFFFFLNIYIY